MWRRIFVLPSVMQIPREQRQKGVADWVVKTQGAAVLKWAVDGAVKWYADGLQIPEDVLLRNAAYKNREDRFAGFIEDYLKKAPEGFATTAGIKVAYEAWCATEKVPQKERLGSTTLLERIETRLSVNRTRQVVNGNKVAGYAGYRVSTDAAMHL
jgi:putative DNA primase/helicase